MTDGEWRVVRRGKKSNSVAAARRISRITSTITGTTLSTTPSYLSVNELQALIMRLRAALEVSKWWHTTRAILLQALHGRHISTLYCIGLGSFSNSANARHQLACALLLKHLGNADIRITISDPAMNAVDKAVAARLGFPHLQPKTTSFSDVAIKPSKPATDAVTLWYLPHCPRGLNEAVLAKCRSFNFQNTVLFANHLVSERGQFNFNDRETNPTLHYLCKHRRMKQRVLPDAMSSTLLTAFNDLSITTIRNSRGSSCTGTS